MKKHTLCLHVSPDLEALRMGYEVREKPDVREKLDIVDEPAVKFIPAGPLQAKDWPGVSPENLNAESLEENGYLFLDCGGGALDQHGKPWLGGQKASIDLLVDYVGLAAVGAHLAPVIKVISDNDLTGKEIVKDGGMKQSSTPNTARHLRNAIIGWNKLLPDRPQEVFDLACIAFRAIDRLVAARTSFLLAKPGATLSRVQDRVKVGQYFLMDAVCGEVMRMLPSEAALLFRGRVQDALNVMQADWEQAIADYDAPSTIVRSLKTARTDGGATLMGDLVIAEGVSDTIRFGQVTRRNTDKGPYANVTVQFRSDGKFMVSSDGRLLTDVAAALRKADLAKRGIACDDADALEMRGHVAVTGADGNTVQAIYFAEFGKAVGNAFRANPYEPLSPLTRDEVMAAVLKGLGVVEERRHENPTAVKLLDGTQAKRLSAAISG